MPRLLLLSLMVFICALPGDSFATEDGARTLEKAATDYKKLLNTEMSVLQIMDNLDEKLRRQEVELEKLQEQRQRITVHLMDLEVRFELATKQLDSERRLIQKRLGSIVTFRRWSRADILLAPEDFIRGSRKSRVIQLLLERDRERIKHYREQLEHFAVERSVLDTRRKELDGMEDKVSLSRNELTRNRQERQDILRLVEEERAWYDKAYSDLKDAYENVTKEIEHLRTWQDKRLDFAMLKGEFRLPMSYARVLTSYGVRANKRLKTATLHHGLEITSKGSESVRAVYWGRVAFIGKLPGYGLTIILDHTEGYHTLYSRLKKVAQIKDKNGNKRRLQEGDIIGSRQVMGTVGGPSALGNPDTLYFELRHEGKAIDPSSWFRDA